MKQGTTYTQTKKSFTHIFTHKIAKARNLRKKRYCAALKGYIPFKENKHLENTYFALLRVAVHHHQALQFQEEVDDTSGWSPFGLENIHVKPAYSADWRFPRWWNTDWTAIFLTCHSDKTCHSLEEIYSWNEIQTSWYSDNLFSKDCWALR